MKEITIDGIEYILTLKEVEYWKPNYGDKYWYIDSIGNAVENNSRDKKMLEKFISLGNYYKTEKEARKARSVLLAEQRLKEAIWKLNGGEFIGFAYDKNNYMVSLTKDLTPNRVIYDKSYPSWYYLKSEELCKQLIESHHNDLMLWLSR